MRNFQKLKTRIIELSTSKNWQEAKSEWDLVTIFRTTEPETCLCDHNPIFEVCVIRNSSNGNEEEIGNVCIHHFLGLNTKSHFNALRRIHKDNSLSISASFLDFVFKKEIISADEYTFYKNIMGKHSPLTIDLLHKEEINRKIIDCYMSQNGTSSKRAGSGLVD